MEKDKTVVVKLKGGMGNQMFQYAFGKSLVESAKMTGIKINLQFDNTAYTNPLKKDTLRPYYIGHLNTEALIATVGTVEKYRNPYGILSKVFRRINDKLGRGNIVDFRPSLLQPPYKNYYEGYWQSEKYFFSISEKIRSEFTLLTPLGTTSEAMRKIIMADENAVSIFYRRTDYVGHKTFDIGAQDYQQDAINKMKELVPNMKLYVMSDDITWVEANADLPEGSVFVSSKQIPPEEEMVLASASKHNIIPNSTFAWWGAWLNKNPNKIVIAPKNWANDNNDYSNITPSNWLRL